MRSGVSRGAGKEGQAVRLIRETRTAKGLARNRGERKAWLSRLNSGSRQVLRDRTKALFTFAISPDYLHAMNNEERLKRFEALLNRAAGMKPSTMNAAYQYKLSKGAPRDIAYEKWGPSIEAAVQRSLWRQRSKELAKPKLGPGPKLDKD